MTNEFSRRSVFGLPNQKKVQVAQAQPATTPPRIQLGGAAAAELVAPGQTYIDADGTTRVRPLPPKPVIARKRTIGIPSRHLQFVPTIEEAVQIAKRAGFDAIEWAVRPGSHITPQRVAQDLPRAMEATQKAGMKVEILSSLVQDAKSPFAEDIAKVMKSLGIVECRNGAYFFYDFTKDIYGQLDTLKTRMQGMQALNARYGTRTIYHTHSSTDEIGGSVWDFWYVMKDLDQKYIGINYDTCHTVSRGGTGWIDAASITRPHIKGLAIKDFAWVRRAGWTSDGIPGWERQMRPVGDGMVDLRDMLEFFGRGDFQGPINIHYEHHDLLGTDVGAYKPTLSTDEIVTLLKADLDYVRSVMAEAKFSA